MELDSAAMSPENSEMEVDTAAMSSDNSEIKHGSSEMKNGSSEIEDGSIEMAAMEKIMQIMKAEIKIASSKKDVARIEPLINSWSENV